MASSFKGLTINDTGYLQLPNGTAANRPSLFSNSAIQWTNTGSQSYSVLAGSATGTNTTWTCPAGVTSIEVLVVAGGGAGNGGTGGGAGGLIYNPAYSVVAGTQYTVTVGAGGSSSAGSNSIFGSLVAIGGGYGNDGTGGGSGGGGQRSSSSSAASAKPGTAGQGNPGGQGAPNDSIGGGGGGGGGAGNPGFNAPASLSGGDGGFGIAYSISGTLTYYAGGGGGAGSTTNGLGGLGGGGGGGGGTSNNATAGTASTGGGGGGWRHPSVNSSGGAAGGSGIVILRYTLADSTTQPYGQTRFNTNLGLTETFNHNNQWSPQTIGEKIVTNGLIMNLDGSCYTTASTTTWYDQTLNGNNGTLTNGPAYTPNYGGGFIFDGSNDYVALPNGLLQGTGDFTVHMWVQPSAGGSNTIFASYPSSNLQLFCYASNMGVYLDGASAYYVPTYGEYNITSPTCMTALRRGTRVEVYINGVFKKYGTQSSTVGGPSTPFRIGTNTSTGEQFTGTVYNCLVYNRALTAAEVTQNYQSQTPRFKKGKKQTLAGWRYIGSGTMSNANLVWSSEQGTKTGYSATCWNEAFVGDFTLVCFWRHDYIGMGVLYGSDISVDGFTGYSNDASGPYAGAMATSGFSNGYQGTYYGQYHAPITGSGGSTPYPGYWFKWQRSGNLVTMQYSTTSGYGPWIDNNSANRVGINSADKVICVIGEASGTEYYPLTFVSLTYNN